MPQNTHVIHIYGQNRYTHIAYIHIRTDTHSHTLFDKWLKMAEVTVCTADPYNQCCSQYRSQGANKGESVIRGQESEGERYAEFYNTNNLLFQTMASTLRKKQSE